MKYAFTKGLLVAACATLVAACSTDNAADQTPLAGKIEVSLRAALPESRAQIAVDEAHERFTGSWETTDALTLYANGETSQFAYDADAKVFKGQLTAATQDWTYQAVYPAADAPLNIPFGEARTQKGNNFNGAYDPLVSAPVTHPASEPGKTPAGEAVTFGLSRLTSILALTFTTDDAAVKGEKVKTVTLTADGRTIAAKSFDITLADQTGALNSAEQSGTITLSYEAGSEPTAESFKAYFNVPAAAYGKLSVVIATEGHTASLDLTSGVELAAGELAYTTKGVTEWDALAAAPTMEWVGHTPNADGSYDKEEIKEGMSVQVNLQAAAGIEDFVIKINSKALTSVLGVGSDGAIPYEGNITTMDLINNASALKLLSMSITFPSPLKGYNQSFSLDLSELVPLILALPEMEEAGITYEDIIGDHVFTLTIKDAQNRPIERTLTFYVPESEPKPEIVPAIAYNNDPDLWTNKASFTLSNLPAEASSIVVKYKATDDSEWHNAEVKGTTAVASPEWEGPFNTAETSPNSTVTPYYRQKVNTGIRNGKTYEYKLIVDGNEYVGTTTFSVESKEANGVIPSLDNAALPCYDWDKCNTDDTWWASGNCITKVVFINVTTTCLSYENNAAKLVSSKPVAVVNLSAGNLFTGKFRKASSTQGEASFGVKYAWNLRPIGIKFSYYGAVAQGTLRTQHKKDKVNPVTSAENDYARIYVAIIDWASSSPRKVSSGKAAPTGTWDPETVNSKTFEPNDVASYGGGKVIGYASYWIDKNNMPTDFSTKTLQFNWYDKEAKPANGNLSLIISCASNAYGDFMCGYDGNYMYIKDFEWVY